MRLAIRSALRVRVACARQTTTLAVESDGRPGLVVGLAGDAGRPPGGYPEVARRACSTGRRGARAWTLQRLPRSVAAARRASSRSTPRRSDRASARSSRQPCGALRQAGAVATSAPPAAVPAAALGRALPDQAGRVRGGLL